MEIGADDNKSVLVLGMMAISILEGIRDDGNETITTTMTHVM